MSKQKKYHFIYRTTCTVTGKFYVGMHSTDNLEDGYLGSGKILGYSRHKYGDENHVREILEYLQSREELKQREKEIVNEQLLSDPLNINLKYGGDGGWDQLNKDGRNVYGTNGKLGFGGENLAKGRTSEIAKLKWKNHRAKYIKALALTQHLMVEAAKSESAKTKRAKTNCERNFQIGEKNSQFGTCWVTKDSKPLKIKKDQLDEYLANGYSRGRK